MNKEYIKHSLFRDAYFSVSILTWGPQPDFWIAQEMPFIVRKYP
jgi:hypothetical protein